MANSKPDFQTIHEVDDTKVEIGEDNEFIEFEMEAEAVFKRLARDIYDREEAGIREPITNSSTAVLRAIEEHDLTPREGVIQIEQRAGTLIIQDNGIGITDAELREVLSVIGRSMNRDREDLSGQFGMGFLSLWMLTGLDGGFIMSTRSRETDELITGVWKSGGFSRVDPEKFEESLDENQYGTRLSINLKDSISRGDIRNWVSKYAEWCRVPVSYREFDRNGTEVFNEDYGNKKLGEDIPNKSPRVTLENEYFRAVSSEECGGKTILLDVPVERNAYISDAPFSDVDIRMKVESGIVVDGPNEGKIPISENEFRKLDGERQGKHVPWKRVTEDDVVMPGPTGTRDRLDSSSKFWNWLSNKLQEIYNEKPKEYFKNISTTEDLLSIDKEKLFYIAYFVRNISLSFHPTPSEIENELKSNYNIDVTTELSETLHAFTEDIKYFPPDTDPSKNSNGRTVYPEEVIWKSKGDDRDGDIFMGVSLNKKKSEIVWEDNENNSIVSLDESDQYSLFEKLGWKKLKEIGESNIDEFDISEETKEEFLGENTERVSSVKRPQDRTLLLHFSKRSRDNQRVKAGTLKSEFKRLNQSEKEFPPRIPGNPKKLILFPTNLDENLTDYYWLTNQTTAIATCSVSVSEYLSEVENIQIVDKYIENAGNKEVLTSNGKIKVKNTPGNIVFHIVDKKRASLFKQTEMFDLFEEYLLKNKGDKIEKHIETNHDTIVYSPLTIDKYEEIRPSLRNEIVVVGDLNPVDVGKVVELRNDSRIYAYARLPEWRGTPEMEFFTKVEHPLEQSYDIIETIAHLHDKGANPHSISNPKEYSKH